MPLPEYFHEFHKSVAEHEDGERLVAIEENDDWMAEPDGSVTVSIGEMGNDGWWIILRRDGTYSLQPITP